VGNHQRFDHYNSDAGSGSCPITPITSAATTPAQLIDGSISCSAREMNASLKAQITQAVGRVIWSSNPSGQALRRLNMVWLITTPDYSVQK
jgi:hypothetical protein